MTKPHLGNVFVLGDSYSTFKGYIPAEHDTYYAVDERLETNVNCVEKTWWYQVFEKTKANLVLNHSWSGTTICNTGYAGPDVPNSFIRRFDKLVADGFFEQNRIDTVFVMGGQNDDWAEAPIGELKTQDWTDEDLLQYGPALCYLMHRLKYELPDARIIFVINSEMKELVMEYQKIAAKLYDLEFVQLNEISKVGGHPTEEGMEQIAERVLEYLKDSFLLRGKDKGFA